MKVILKADVPSIGKKRDIKDVKSGYFQNYLAPKGLAMEASKENIAMLEKELEDERIREEELRKEAIVLKEKIEKLEIKLKAKLGPDGKIYGSITSKDVAGIIEKEIGCQIDKRKVNLDNIKTIGIHVANIKLHPKVEAKVSIDVESE